MEEFTPQMNSKFVKWKLFYVLFLQFRHTFLFFNGFNNEFDDKNV